jgi:S1-C subfamily serine protease
MTLVIAALALAVAVPAVACDGHKKASASSASADGYSCGSKSTTAWAGAWLERSSGGELTVVAVAENSPAAKSGLRAGDIVLAVNGKSIAEKSMSCASGTACSVGSAWAYTVQRGKATKTVKVKLEKMPADASTRFASREASYEHTLAAMVIPTVD